LFLSRLQRCSFCVKNLCSLHNSIATCFETTHTSFILVKCQIHPGVASYFRYHSGSRAEWHPGLPGWTLPQWPLDRPGLKAGFSVNAQQGKQQLSVCHCSQFAQAFVVRSWKSTQKLLWAASG